MELISWIAAFIVAITVHETAHAWMSDKLGDPTARLMGRLSLNPVVHYDPVGTTLLLVLTVMRAFGLPVIPFGWAKPVPFDPYNLKNPRRDSALISFAGPGANIVLAILMSLLLRLFPESLFLFSFATPMIMLNILLALFNLVPIHPLDGGKIFIGFLPEDQAREAELFLRRYGMIILLFLIFPTIGGTSPLFMVLSPVLDFILRILIP
ncbi:site-2 protease family protein [Patescibacteria group bacterium]